MPTIYEFEGPYRFLSNFWPCEIEWRGLVYPSVEAAYQAGKTLDLEERKKFTQYTPQQAKRAGKALKLRPDWDMVKDQIMTYLVRKKFENPRLRKALLDTLDSELQEGNWWGDKYWGISPAQSGQGENKLGKILMAERSLIRSEKIAGM